MLVNNLLPFESFCYEGVLSMADCKFVHLHVHTEYSLLDGASRIPDLIARVKELGMNAVAITDHGNMYGAVTFYKEAVKAGRVMDILLEVNAAGEESKFGLGYDKVLPLIHEIAPLPGIHLITPINRRSAIRSQARRSY